MRRSLCVTGKTRPVLLRTARSGGRTTFHFRLPKRLGLILALSGGVGLAALSVIRWANDAELSPPPQRLELSAQDVDPESTALVLRLLRDDQVDGRLALALMREAGPATAGASEPLAVTLNQGRIPPALAGAAQSLRNALERGEAYIYTVWVRAAEPALSLSEPRLGPSPVLFSLDGYALGSFPAGQDRYPLSLLLRTNVAARLRIRASNANQDPVALQGETAAAEVFIRRLRHGCSQEWVLAPMP
ncbi:MAG: hypothetical protein JO069_16540 [Verrucomicrobia bacterium]|nr:hypothetical protein [Verrucomicrobiota bacterium]